jgi:hypothetical protein
MERRETPRHPCQCDIVGVLPANRPVAEPRAFRGSVVNLSDGGACVTIDRFIERQTVLPFGFAFPNVPVPLPVFAQVQWIEPASPEEGTFRLGLLFIS